MTAPRHTTEVLAIQTGQWHYPTIYRVRCSCGWTTPTSPRTKRDADYEATEHVLATLHEEIR